MTSVDTNLQTDPFILARDLSGKHFYAGEMRASLSGKVFPVINPATGEQVAEAAFGEAADVEAAVQGAYAAQKAWKKVSARDRGKLVVKCGQILAEHAEELARLIALETGKALRTESRVEASVAGRRLHLLRRAGVRVEGRNRPLQPDGHDHDGARADRHRRRDPALERAAAADGAEDRPGPGRRQRRHRQVGGGSAADGAARRSAHEHGDAAGVWSTSCRASGRNAALRWCRTPRSAR